MLLPPELILYIAEFMDPFHKYNFFKTIGIQPSKKFKNEFENYISDFCQSEQILIQTIHKFIDTFPFIDQMLFNIVKELYFIIKRSKKYTDILGYRFYKFVVFKSISEFELNGSIHLYPNYSRNNETYHIHIYYKDPILLCQFLDVFFEKRNDNSSYTITNYNIKKLFHSFYNS